MTIIKHSILALCGAFLYGLIEIAVRGYTHWTMLILGGFCFLVLGWLNEYIPWEWAITTQALAGSAAITIAELLTGIVVNLQLAWDIWDYSDKPYNYLGQICAENTFYWFLLSFVGIILDDYLRYRFFDEEKPHYRL